MFFFGLFVYCCPLVCRDDLLSELLLNSKYLLFDYRIAGQIIIMSRLEDDFDPFAVLDGWISVLRLSDLISERIIQ
jgi:hypothetical protein